MNLWNTLGVSPLGGVLIAAAGIAAAIVWATLAFRRSSRPERRGLGLEDR
jgi:hypothetical protein